MTAWEPGTGSWEPMLLGASVLRSRFPVPIRAER